MNIANSIFVITQKAMLIYVGLEAHRRIPLQTPAGSLVGMVHRMVEARQGTEKRETRREDGGKRIGVD